METSSGHEGLVAGSGNAVDGGRSPRGGPPETPPASGLWMGIAAGFVGYAVVALILLVADLLAGRPAFYTPALLGSALFEGLRDPARLVVWAGPVAAYNAVHLLVFIVLGVVLGLLASRAARIAHVWYLGAVLFLFVLFHVFGVVLTLADLVDSPVSSWTLLAATLLAVAAMVAVLLWGYPHVRREFRARDYPE